MKLFSEFEGKKAGDRVRMWCDRGTIKNIIAYETGELALVYLVDWDDHGLASVSFDRDENWFRET